MMHESEKSDLVIVAGKSANKVVPAAEQSAERSAAAESMERRTGTKGNADRQSTHWTQERIRQAFAVIHPRWEPYTGKPHVRIWAGACDETHVPTATLAGGLKGRVAGQAC
jgi:hypothetical protein